MLAIMTAFEVAIDGGVLRGCRGGTGVPALLLHGGAAVPDYMGDCAELLDGLFATIRYTQRGTPPSGGAPPYAVEVHAADAIAVLDAFEIDRAWAIGHSWGGHLALHLAVTHPERLLGVLCIDPLGAFSEVFAEQDANVRAKLSPDVVARLDELEARRREGAVTEPELVERFRIIWPAFFAEQPAPSFGGEHVGVQASIEVNRSLAQHFERGTLRRALPEVRLEALFVHGDADPMPSQSTIDTAALIPGSRVDVIPNCGHFPWLEQPEAFRSAVERLLATVHEMNPQ
jgi:pimeloyl-ACP methyl ester carboxylesterase